MVFLHIKVTRDAFILSESGESFILLAVVQCHSVALENIMVEVAL